MIERTTVLIAALLCGCACLAEELPTDVPPGRQPPPSQARRVTFRGASYASASGPRALSEVDGLFAVTAAEHSGAESAIRTLLESEPLFEGYAEKERISRSTVIIMPSYSAALKHSADRGRVEQMRQRASKNAEILSCNPVYFDPVSGLELVVTPEIIVCLRNETNAEEYFSDCRDRIRPIAVRGPQYVVRLTNTAAEFVLAEVNRHAADPRVRWAEPNFLGPIVREYAPNDILFTNQWHHDHIGQNGTKTNADVRTPQAWDIIRGGSSNVLIAIIDDGVEISHPDLFGNVYINPNEAANALDDDGNGYTNDYTGWDFADNDNQPSPDVWDDAHGTSCAGMAAATGDNAVGGAGIAYRCRILPCKIVSAGAWAAMDVRAEAIRYAAGIDGAGNPTWRGADVISMSWRGTQSAVADSALSDANDDGRQGHGTVLFGSSGNAASGYMLFKGDTGALPAGNYFIQFEYYKDGAGVDGDDTVWLSRVTLPDEQQTREFFNSPALPANWSVGGNVPFTIEDDPEHAYGTGRYQARSGAIGHNQVSWIRTPTFALAPGTNFYFATWVDSERGTVGWSYPPVGDQGDWLFVRLCNTGTGIWTDRGYEAGVPGWRQNISGDAVATNEHYPSIHTDVIGVGGITDCGYRYHGSQYRLTGLEFVAPTAGGVEGVWTTDRTGTNGYNTAVGTNGNYTPFSGTSAACPQAAGIGALLLSVNSNLTPAQVRQRMKDSCTQVGGLPYVNGTNLYYGHGRVNAYHALLSNAVPENAVVTHETVRNQRIYYAGDTLTASNQYSIVPPAGVEFRSGRKINLRNGFSAVTGSLYRTVIDPTL